MAVGSTHGRRARDYPPLMVAGLAMLAMLALLPSALNMPQSNPSQTLEYAPVPPEDDAEVTPPAGNFSSLGLGSSGSIGTGGRGFDLPPQVPEGRVIKTPSTKRCVGNPPRQTEDPLSPPCVATFSGDNGGATYQGVSQEEIRVLFYFEGCGSQIGSSRGSDSIPCGKYFDLAKPPESEPEHPWIQTLRPYQRYFNERFQTYGRFVHFFAYYDGGTSTAETRRADAIDNFRTVKPFAVYNQGNFGFTEEYTKVMLRRGALVFTGAQATRFLCCEAEEVFREHAGLRWGTASSTDHYARLFSDLICKQVARRPVSFSGNGDNGRARKFGMIQNDRPNHRAYGELARQVKAQVERCGVSFAHVANSGPEGACSAEAAAAEIAEFRRLQITTIIWPVGNDMAGDDGCSHYFHRAAGGVDYLPELVVAGNGSSETPLAGQLNDPEWARHMMMMTAYPRADQLAATPCIYSAKEADPDIPNRDLENFGCEMYAGIRLLFTGIQVAGPKLTPASMDKGYHAIPDKPSNDPYSEACFFEPGDYTCVKDAQLQWWDETGQTPGTAGNGCFRMIDGGARHLAGSWPDRDIASAKKPGDPCNRQGYSVN